MKNIVKLQKEIGKLQGQLEKAYERQVAALKKELAKAGTPVKATRKVTKTVKVRKVTRKPRVQTVKTIENGQLPHGFVTQQASIVLEGKSQGLTPEQVTKEILNRNGEKLAKVIDEATLGTKVHNVLYTSKKCFRLSGHGIFVLGGKRRAGRKRVTAQVAVAPAVTAQPPAETATATPPVATS